MIPMDVPLVPQQPGQPQAHTAVYNSLRVHIVRSEIRVYKSTSALCRNYVGHADGLSSCVLLLACTRSSVCHLIQSLIFATSLHQKFRLPLDTITHFCTQHNKRRYQSTVRVNTERSTLIDFPEQRRYSLFSLALGSGRLHSAFIEWLD